MAGSIIFRHDRSRWVVSWSWKGKVYKVSRYKGKLMYGNGIRNKKKDLGFAQANKLLHQMQGDVENGTFRIEKYTEKGWTDVIPFFEKWLKEQKRRKPATYDGYVSYFKNWIKPFFESHPVQLHEIKLDILMEMSNFILEGLKEKENEPNPKTELILKEHRKNPELKSPSLRRLIIERHDQKFSEGWIRQVIRESKKTPKKKVAEEKNFGKTVSNIMYCFHAYMVYAKRSDRIIELPPFPRKEDYQIKEPTIQWLPSDRQIAVIEAIPEEDQPIFWFLKYHLRRPAEACALHKCDYDQINKVFTIRRSISARKLVTSTKTGREHIIPCHRNLVPLIDHLAQQPGEFMFQNSRARTEGKRYTGDVLNRIWKAACEKTGENIGLYPGVKHSSCSQYINELGMALSDLQTITDHARLDSVKKYAKTEVARKRELLESGTNGKITSLLKLVKGA